MEDLEPYDGNHRNRRWLIVAICLVAGVLIGLFFWQRGKDEGGEPYRTEAVSRGEITATASATGTLSAVTTVQIGSQVSGIVARLYADFNSQVTKGQLLAELDPTPFLQAVEQRQAEVTRSQVEVANIQVTYNRQKRLAAAGLISQADLDGAKAAYDAASAGLALSQASLRQAKTNLGYTKIYSPIDGQVVDRQYDVGQTVAASFSAPTLFTIAQDLTKMQVKADVDQSDIGRVKAGAAVRFTVDAYPDQQFRGNISQVRLNATVTQNVITYPVIVEVANPDLRLRPSMTADVTIEVATVEDALRVPNAALRFRPATDPDEDGGAGGQGGRSGAGRRERSSGTGSAGSESTGRGERAGGGEGRRSRGQTVYVLAGEGEGNGKKGELRQVRVATGITDGRTTEVTRVLSGALAPGDLVVTGLATLKTESNNRANRATTSPLGGAPPMGRGRGGRF
jgi:HlyD family secretion protein